MRGFLYAIIFVLIIIISSIFFREILDNQTEKKTEKVEQKTSPQEMGKSVIGKETQNVRKRTERKASSKRGSKNIEPPLINSSQRPLYQPDTVVYSVNRHELLRISESSMKTFPLPWIVASAQEGTPSYNDFSMKQIKFKASFLQRFEVLDKAGPRLRVKELDAYSPQTGWVEMKNLIYLPRALNTKRTAIYQKVVFAHSYKSLETGKLGKITFYKSPAESNESSNVHQIKAMGPLRIAYVYAWEESTYIDSKFVLLGSYPSINRIVLDKKAFKRVIYGWCKTSVVFPWNSRMAVIPNPKARYPSYIFRTGPDLVNFYKNVQDHSVPDPKRLLVLDSKDIWPKSRWPFFLRKKFRRQEFLGLICLVEAQEYRGTYLMTFGYSVEVDPRSRHIKQFKNVYLFRKSEILAMLNILNITLRLLKSATLRNNLLKELIDRCYGQTYEPGRTFNEYAKMHDGITYRNLSLLFDKTQEQISRLRRNDLEIIEREVFAVKERMESLINDEPGERFFGSMDDLYIWLYEDELP